MKPYVICHMNSSVDGRILEKCNEQGSERDRLRAFPLYRRP